MQAEDAAMSILALIIDQSAKELHKHAMMQNARDLCARNTVLHGLEAIELDW